MNKSELNPVTKAVEASLNHHFPDSDNWHAVIGVSGGPDSMALLYQFHLLELEGTVVHCNYQLRGRASDRDQRLVEEVASMWGFECISVRFDPPEKETGGNFQNRARDQRYQVFSDIKNETGANAICLAHHQDDQLETIIQKIMRGSGMAAWQGMQEWDGRIYRPLLGFSKAKILEYASENNIPFRLDSSNEESTYARNFLRNGWFPALDDLFPGWRDNLLKVQARGEEHELLLKAFRDRISPDGASVDRQTFLDLDPRIRGSLLMSMLLTVAGSSPVSGNRLDTLPDFSRLQTGKKIQLNDEWNLFRDRDRFLLQHVKEEKPKSMVLSRNLLGSKIFRYAQLAVELSGWDGSIDTARLQVDADIVTWPLKVRAWKAGDRLNPLGMEGSQSVADLLTNRKISAVDKHKTRVVETANGEICAVIYPVQPNDEASVSISGNSVYDREPGAIADWARCTSSTSHVLTLRPLAESS